MAIDPFTASLLVTGISTGANLLLNKKPDIPEPKEPRDFTRAERTRLEGIVREGDPLRELRDTIALNRILTNSANADFEQAGISGGQRLAFEGEQTEGTQNVISDYLLRSSQLEQERVLGAEERLNMLTAERLQDLDEYEQMKLRGEAAEEVADARFRSGLLRAGGQLLGFGLDAYFEYQNEPANSGTGGMGNEVEASPTQAEVGFGNQPAENLFDTDTMVTDYPMDERRASLGFDNPRARERMNELLFDFGADAEFPFTSKIRTLPLF